VVFDELLLRIMCQRPWILGVFFEAMSPVTQMPLDSKGQTEVVELNIYLLNDETFVHL
jgi:hypothetical protein